MGFFCVTLDHTPSEKTSEAPVTVWVLTSTLGRLPMSVWYYNYSGDFHVTISGDWISTREGGGLHELPNLSPVH